MFVCPHLKEPNDDRDQEDEGRKARGVEAACSHAERRRQAVLDPHPELQPFRENPDWDTPARSDTGPRISAAAIATRTARSPQAVEEPVRVGQLRCGLPPNDIPSPLQNRLFSREPRAADLAHALARGSRLNRRNSTGDSILSGVMTCPSVGSQPTQYVGYERRRHVLRIAWQSR